MDNSDLVRRRDAGIGRGENKGQRGPSVPAKAKKAIAYLLDVEDSIEKAAAHAGLQVFLLKRYLNLTHVRRHLYDERQVRLDVARAGNVPALIKVRDTSENGMAIVAAAKTLEQIGVDNEQDGVGSPKQQAAGVTIIIQSRDNPQVLTPPVIDVTPEPPHHWPSTD